MFRPFDYAQDDKPHRSILRIVLSLMFVAAMTFSLGSCMSPCRKMQKTNAKLIAGKADFGKKTGKWKRKQHY